MEVFVLWGEPGTRQLRIRAKVDRFPYFDENRNSTFDVDAIPPARPELDRSAKSIDAA
jgi:vanillate/3-O-methylgallate O-demethylase